MKIFGNIENHPAIAPAPIYVLLQCWHTGDMEFIDDSFIGCSNSCAKLVETALKEGATHVYLPGSMHPQEGHADIPCRMFRIVERNVI